MIRSGILMSVNPEKRKGKPPRFGRAKVDQPLPRNGEPPAPTGMKRSTKVVLVMAGTAAIATYMATREPVCKQPDPNDWNSPANPQPCRSSSRTSSSSGGAWRWSSGTTSSSVASSRTSSSTQGVVSRGGFGSTGSSISGHGGS
ncbi:MAG: hypothetical protein ABL904_21110 [Hyphomicrobiaceae bacterium]